VPDVIRRSRIRRDEEGSALIIVAVSMICLLAFMTFSIDVGNWFFHKRHLQMQADAAALSTAQDVAIACRTVTPDTNRITERAKQYAGYTSTLGDTYNPQVANRQGSVHMLINSATYYGQSTADDTDTREPCAASMVDVKLTETDLPFFVKLINGAVPGNVVPNINAHARIGLFTLESQSGFLPVAVPQSAPTAVRATILNETTGETIDTVDLSRNGTSAGGLALWDNVAAPKTISIPTTTEHIGVRLALGEGSSVTCGQPLVTCFDASSSAGLIHARAYPTDGTATSTSAPILRSVALEPGGGACASPMLVFTQADCNVTLRATAEWGTGATDPTINTSRRGSLTATVSGNDYALTYDASSKTFYTTSLPVVAQAGPIDVSLKWSAKNGSVGATTCSTGSPCTGSFGTVQRVMSGDGVRNGPIQLATIDSGASTDVSAFAQGTSQQLVIRVGLTGNLAAAQDVGDPVVTLRVAGEGALNQSLDCDPDISNIRDEIRLGCYPKYTRNTGTTCPSSPPALWSTPQPWSCVAVQTGGSVGQIRQGLQDRIQGGASTCVNPNQWSTFPALPPEDPRIVALLLTPYNTFGDGGTTTVPVQSFAYFYMTGYDGSPCSGDDSVANGYITGHFIKYVHAFADATTTGSASCRFAAVEPCYARMTG